MRRLQVPSTLSASHAKRSAYIFMELTDNL